MSTNFVSLREAVKVVLDGEDLLDDPNRMKGCILDLADGTDPEVKLVAQQYDVDLAAHLFAAAEQPDTASLVAARSRIAQELEEGRFMNHDVSWAAADGLVGGLADHLGVTLPSMGKQQPAPSGIAQDIAAANMPKTSDQTASVGDGTKSTAQQTQPQQPAPRTQPQQHVQQPQPTQPVPSQPAQPVQPQQSKSRLPLLLACVAIALAAVAIVVTVVVLGGPAQQSSSNTASSPAGSTSSDTSSSASAGVNAQDLGWDEVPLYDGGGVWVMTSMVSERHAAGGSLIRKNVRNYEIDEHGNRLRISNSITGESVEDTTLITYCKLDGVNESGWPRSISFIDESGSAKGNGGIEYLYDNPQIFLLTVNMNRKGGGSTKEVKSFGETRAIGTDDYYEYDAGGKEVDRVEEEYSWQYDTNSLPTSSRIEYSKGDSSYIFYYDENDNIMRVDTVKKDNSEYSFYEPKYTYVEHPSMWAYICSRMYDIFPPIY